jgi:hypothetical protein
MRIKLHEWFTNNLQSNPPVESVPLTQVLGGARLPVPPPDLLPGPDVLPEGPLQCYVELMQRCWEANPAERPTFAAIAAQLR